MASEKIYIIDESMGGTIPADYNLLLDTSINMEDYIEIKEKKLPGKKPSFNNIQDVETKEVCVTGLLLHFSQDVADSKLSSILRRTDIEHLYLYADTIIINDKLSFPQANVTITCRYLIMDEHGTLSTTPEPHAVQYAQGNGGDIRKAGAPGEPAGTLNLVCDTIDNRHPNDENIFFMNGANGQNGERGDVKKPSKTGSPLSWTDIENTVLKHDFFVGKTSDWKWADFDNNKKNKIYYARVQPYNFWFTTPYLDKKLGDENAVNQDNGADAIASGAGGNGGAAGNFYFFNFQERRRKIPWEAKGGEGGKSVKIAPGKKAKDSTYYHIVLRAFHHDPQYDAMDRLDFEKKHQPFCDVIKKIEAVDGKDAPAGAEGQRGAYGKVGWVDFEKYHWVCPVLLETVLGFAKANYREGRRQRAKWILDHYSKGMETLTLPLREDMQMAALIREMELYQRKLAQNLDFYGYPPGWIPKLSALSNLNILIASKRDLAQLIYFANDLLERDDARGQEKKEIEWTADEMKKGIKNAQADINAAFEALPRIKNEIFTLEAQVKEQLGALRDLKKTILREIEDKVRAQALFTGSFDILAGICTMIPVGQPYLGQLGGDILKRIGKIDIDSENPLGEAFSFAGGLSGEVKGFIDKNEEKLKAKANSQLSKEIDKGTKELSDFKAQADEAKEELQQANNAINGTFGPQEVALLREQIRIVRNSGTGSASPYNMNDDYCDILADIAKMKTTVEASKHIAEEQKKTLQAKLDKLATDKSELAASLKARKATRDRREKNIEKAGKVIKGFTDGISGISSGIQKMMVVFDEDDTEVQKKMEAIKKSKYKKEFETIYDKIADINKLKLPLVEKLLRFEQSISSAVQRINNNLVQWSVLSDQRVLSIQYGLMPATRASLKRIKQESWDLLMLECYYFTKSYQYRFLKKIDPVGHGMEKFLKDVKNLIKAEKPAEMNDAAYEKIFNLVLASQFKALAADLLVNVQSGAGKVYVYNSVPVITKSDKNADGESILDRLNTYGQVNFRLEDIKSSKHGTDDWMHYRIKKIAFERIEVKGDENASFDFGIRHSGDSYIRAANKKIYYFTSRTSRSGDKEESKSTPATSEGKPNESEYQEVDLDLQVQSWGASYNGADRNKPDKGLTNATESDEDEQLLDKLLSDFKLKDDYDKANKPYKSHYPGGSSELTLVIYDNSATWDFTIEELAFKVEYEVLN
jgi:hypothetical protein